MHLHKPYNSYNLYFTLERTLLVEARQQSQVDDANSASTRSHIPSFPNPSPSAPTAAAAPNGYDFIDIPPLPPRYQHLKKRLPTNWYVPGKNKLVKRKHSKTHGVASFTEVAKTVSANWKAVDPVTKEYVETIAKVLKKRHSEIKSAVDKNARQEEENKKQQVILRLQMLHQTPEQPLLSECHERAMISSLDTTRQRVSISHDRRLSAQNLKLVNDYLFPEQENLNNCRQQRDNLKFGLCQMVDKMTDNEIRNHNLAPKRVSNVIDKGSTLEQEMSTDRQQRNHFKFALCQEVGMTRGWDSHNHPIAHQSLPNILDRDDAHHEGLVLEQFTSNDLQYRNDHGYGVLTEVDMSDWDILNRYLSD